MPVDEGLREAERHGGVVGPAAGGEVEVGVVLEAGVGCDEDGGEGAAAAEFEGGAEGVAGGEGVEGAADAGGGGGWWWWVWHGGMRGVGESGVVGGAFRTGEVEPGQGCWRWVEAT